MPLVANVLIAGLAMAGIALSGGLTLLMPPKALERLITAFAALNFLYIPTVDLIPEVTHSRPAGPLIEVFGAFALGILLMVVTLLPRG